MASQRYEPGGTLLQGVIILMIANILLTAVGAWSTALEISLLTRLEATEDVTDEEIDGNDARQRFLGLLQLSLYIVLGIIFLRSLSRANRNARSFGVKGMEFTPGWCMGWYFVPIMNLFKPYQAVQEIWRASTSTNGRWQDNPVPPILGIWWTMWIISAVAGQASFRMSMRAETISQLRTSSIVTLVSDVIDLPLGLVALLMIRGLYSVQERRHEQLADNSEHGSCPSCGDPLEAGDQSCPRCGHQLEFDPSGW
jgi:hypothetical protein